MEYHNFALQHYFKFDTVDYQQVLDEALAQAEQIKPMIEDVPGTLQRAASPGSQRDVRGAGCAARYRPRHLSLCHLVQHHAGGAASGSGVGPRDFDYVLGIVKAYTTRVGAGPFPTELFDDDGEHLGVKGHEFGATTGRKRRCGWLDTVALKRSLQINSVTGMCITKLDVMDGPIR